MLVSQPINRWDHQPPKGLLGYWHFLGRQGSHKRRISLLGWELEREKHCFQNWGGELSKNSAWKRHEGQKAGSGGGCHGCCLKSLAWRLESPAKRTTEKDFTLPERVSEFLSQTMPEGWVALTCWDTKSFEFDQTGVYIGKDLNIISSTFKYTLCLL